MFTKVERAKWVKGMNCVMTDGSQMFVGQLDIRYTEIEIKYSTCET